MTWPFFPTRYGAIPLAFLAFMGPWWFLGWALLTFVVWLVWSTALNDGACPDGTRKTGGTQ